MTITTQEPLVPDSGDAEKGLTWLEVDGPAARTVFVGHATGLGSTSRASGDEGSAGVASAAGAVGPVVVRPVSRPRRAGRRVVATPVVARHQVRTSVACADPAGPSMHGARLTRRGRLLVAVAWLILAVVAAVPIVNAIDGDSSMRSAELVPAESVVVGEVQGAGSG